MNLAPNLRGDVMVPIPKFIQFAARKHLTVPHHTHAPAEGRRVLADLRLSLVDA